MPPSPISRACLEPYDVLVQSAGGLGVKSGASNIGRVWGWFWLKVGLEQVWGRS